MKMNFVKGFWSSAKPTASNGEIQSQPNAIHSTQQNFNSVTFTTTTATNGNSIIITTVPQSTQPIAYQSTEFGSSQIAKSPTDSFHSVASTFEQQQQTNGKVNLAYVGSTTEINNNNVHQPHHSHHRHHNNTRIQPLQQSRMVVREQYWSWNWPWQRWNSREKIFLIVIIVLSLCVLTLTSILSVVLQKNFQYRDMILSRGNSDAEHNI